MRAARWGEWSFRLAMAGSLFLCCAAALLWYRGRPQYHECHYFDCNSVSYSSQRTSVWLWSGGGRIRAGVCSFHPSQAPENPGIRVAEIPEIRPEWLDEPQPFGASRRRAGIVADIWSVWVPHWAVLSASGLAAAALLVYGVSRHRKSAAGVCATCGYDLRASPERCPECGTPKMLLNRQPHDRQRDD